MQPNDAKSQYSEMEAAARLGISVNELRALVRMHISNGEETPVTSFRASDLVILRILANQQPRMAAAAVA